MILTRRTRSADGADEVEAPGPRGGAGRYEGLRRYILKSVDVRTWKQMSRELAATFENIRPFLQGRLYPGGPSDFSGLNFRDALRGQNRLVYEVRGDAIYIRLVIDMRRDLRTLLRPLHSCW